MIQIKKKNSVIMILLFDKLPWSILVIFISLIVCLVSFGDSNFTLALMLVPVLPILYWVYLFLDAKKFVDSASIKVSENTIDFHSENLFNRSNNSLPIAQVNNAHVHQGFILKIFGISGVVFSDESGSNTSLWGFNYDDSVAFVEEFGKRYKIKISR